MSISTSVLEELLRKLPHLRPQIYFKASLTALSHAMEDQVLAGNSEPPLIIANFQRERFYRQEAHRYLRLSGLTSQIYVLAAPEASFTSGSDHYETIAFEPDDQLTHEWHLIVIGSQYSTCLVCRERQTPSFPVSVDPPGMDQTRRFEGIWTFDRQVCCQAADILLERIQIYRPELTPKIQAAKADFLGNVPSGLRKVDPDPFAQRLVTYLQAGQYKLLKAYRSMAAQERRERLVNLITSAIRQSLDPDEIFNVAVQELGQAMQVCRCLMYRCKSTDATATIQHEFLSSPTLNSLLGEQWPIRANVLFQTVMQSQEAIAITDTQDEEMINLRSLQQQIDQWQIRSWLIAPIFYQGRLMGMVELHGCTDHPTFWSQDVISMVEAIAAQLAIALIQAEAYANLEDLNQQLEALERTRSNLIAITGHELRTPLSTIQVCLESLATEPDMPLELRQVMLSTALDDAERLRHLVQDFLTLSQLESGRVDWHIETISLQECIDLALSSIRAHHRNNQLPDITTSVPADLPLVRADGEWLVEVLSKLLDNACKFTEPTGQVKIGAQQTDEAMLKVTVKDTGRGIEPNRLEIVFDRFYQEEGALRRTTGGTGLGLAICRQVIAGMGGEIWAESNGRGQGSQFHFTLPMGKNGFMGPDSQQEDGQARKLEPQSRKSSKNKRSQVSGRRARST
jgi:DICT domain-containing protein/signal transduction histidine kinase